jgi:spermidine synthase
MLPSLVFLTVLLVATCGMVYQFIAGTLSSYLLGGGITQFSLVIGVFLSALGIGSYLSRFVEREVARRFIEVELAVAVIGGLAAPILFLAYSRPSSFHAILYSVVVLEGTLVGLEVPLIVRMLRRRVQFKDLVARALAFDYLGSFLAGIVFVFVFLPSVGLIHSGILFGMVNALVALSGTWLFASSLSNHRSLRIKSVAVLVVLAIAFIASDRLTRISETMLYADRIVYAEQTRFQRIVVTAGRGGHHLFLDGNLQFSSLDEYRYHEALVHPVFAARASRDRILVLGGGDGLAVREILRYPEVQEITLVDIDPGITALASSHPLFVELNHGALNDPKVRIINDDAMAWLREGDDRFDIVIIDFPDPNNYTLGKLYTTTFYRLVLRRLHPEGAIAIQSTSPLMARQSFWCIVTTLEEVGMNVLPYRALVPSFGEWGYVLAAPSALQVPTGVPDGLRYLNDDVLRSLFVFSPDMSRIAAEPNRLSSQSLVRYYEADWRKTL